MSVDHVRAFFTKFGRDQDILEFSVSSATVEPAAQAVGVEGARIAKTLSFHDGNGGCLLIVAAGDAKVNNRKFKDQFGMKAKMLSSEEALAMTGHAVGGVCPFALPEQVAVYLDESMRRFDTVFPACGSSNSAIEVTCSQLEEYSNPKAWVDVCTVPGQEP